MSLARLGGVCLRRKGGGRKRHNLYVREASARLLEPVSFPCPERRLPSLSPPPPDHTFFPPSQPTQKAEEVAGRGGREGFN